MVLQQSQHCKSTAISMEEISNLFPNGVRALVVDDDSRFLISSSMVLSTLNFKVDTCRSVASALRLLNQEKIKYDVDAIFVNAEKAAVCSFDFREIVESHMFIPVLYFLPLDLEVTGDEATLIRPGTNIVVKKPLDANEVCNLWRGIAWRKSSLEAKAAADQAGGGRRVLHEAVVEALLAGGRGRKRKKQSSSNPSGSSGTSSLAGSQAAMRQQQMNLTEGQRERDNMGLRGMGTGKNNGKAPVFQQPRAMDGRQPGRQQQQQQSPPVQSVLGALDVPPYNPRIYADTAGLSNNAGAGASNTGALPPALAPPPVNPSPVPAPAPRPVYPAARNVFGATAPSAAVATMAAGGRSPLMPRPFSASYLQGPPPRIVQQDMFAPGTPSGAGTRPRETGAITLNFQQPPAAAGDVFTGMASGAVMTFGASAAATGSNPPLAPHHVGVASNEPAMGPGLYGNNYCYRSLVAPRLIDHRGVTPANQAAVAMGSFGSDGYIDYSSASAMAPLQADHGHGVASGTEEEALDTIANNFSNYGSASSLAPDHEVLGMHSNVNELTIPGGAAFGDNASASFTPASQDLVVAAANGNQLAPGALDLDDDGDLSGSAMRSHQIPDMAMDGDAGFAAMSPADQYPAHTNCSMEELLGPDDQQGGATDGAAADADDAAGTSLIGGEGGNGTLDIGAAGGATDVAAADADNAAGTSLIGGEGGNGTLDIGAAGGATDVAAAGAAAAAGTLLIGGEGGNGTFDIGAAGGATDVAAAAAAGGATDVAAAAAAAAAAGTLLIGGEGGDGTLDIGEGGDGTLDIGADGFNLDDDFILGDLWNFRFQPYN